MRKTLRNLFLFLSFFLLPTLHSVAFAQAASQDECIPMTGAFTKVRLSTVSNVKLAVYKSTTSTDGEVTSLMPLCQYMSFVPGVKNLGQCSAYIENDNTDLVIAAFSKDEAGAVMGSIEINSAAYSFDDPLFPEVVSQSTVPHSLASFSIPQIVSELNNGTSGLSTLLGQNGDAPWGWLPYSDQAFWVKIGLPAPQPGYSNYKLFRVKNCGPLPVYTAPALTFTANNSVGPVSLATSTTPVTLDWSATAGSSCTASTTTAPLGSTTYAGTSSVWNGAKTTSGSFVPTPLLPNTSYKFKLDCMSTGGSHTVKTVVVNVPQSPAPTVTISATPTTVTAGGTSMITWSSTNATSCTMSNGSAGWSSVTGTSGSWATGLLNSTGSFAYNISCSGASGTAPAIASAVITVTQAPAIPTVTISANPTSVTAGGTSTITWSSTNATVCTMTNGSTGWTSAAGTSGSWTTGVLNTVGTINYDIACSVPPSNTPAKATVAVTVSAAPLTPTPTVHITATPTNIQSGESTTLAWTSTNATTCTRIGGSTGWPTIANSSVNGNWTTATLTPGSYAYTITCDNTAGSATASATVTVTSFTNPPSPIITIFANPTNVTVGGGSTLSWIVHNATSCTMSNGSAGWSSVTGTGGSWTTGPLNTTGDIVYTITCYGASGAIPATASVTVTVTVPTAAPTVTISASPNPIKVNQKTTLTWNASGDITSCTKTGPTTWMNVAGNSGTWQTGTLIKPGTRTYTISCTGPGGTDTKSVTVTWNPSDTVPLSVHVTSVPTNAPLLVGGTATVNWTSNGATSCTMTNFIGGISSLPVSVDVNGAITTPALPVGTHTYTLTCMNAGGATVSDSTSLIVKFADSTPIVPTVTISASSNAVTAGNTAVITWSSTNATSCVMSGGSKGWLFIPGNASGSWTTAPLTTGTYTYGVSCTGPGGTTPAVSTTVSVTSPPPVPSPTVSLKVNGLKQHNVTVTNPAVTLSWSSTNTTSNCTASTIITSDGVSTSSSLWSGSKPSTGTSLRTVTADKTYNFKITCTGINGTVVNDTVTVILVKPPVVDLKAIVNGASLDGLVKISSTTPLKLSWTSTYANTCTATSTKDGNTTTSLWSGSKSLNGTSKTISNLQSGSNYVFTLTCAGAYGSTSDSINVHIQ